MTYDFNSSIPCNADPLGPSLAAGCDGSTVLAFMSILNALVRANNRISGICDRVKSVKTPDEEYDFVVIGGGAGGSAVAGRLTEIPKWRVLLLEAGPEEPAGAAVPGFATKFIGLAGSGVNWDYKTTNEANACLATNGSCDWTSGRNLGGNTAHNGMIYLRGNPTDYNNWAELGNEGWTWGEVESYLKKGEGNGEIERVGREHHGTDGPLPVERFPYMPPIGDSILRAAKEIGYGVSEDLNGDRLTGYSRVQGMQRNGVRHSSARSYLWPARKRANLHVSLNSTVTRLIIENDRAIGVEYYKDGEARTVYVAREVVLAAGVVGSPHILLLSGIGPKEHLESVGVQVVKDLPGVGENLHDHPCALLAFTVNDTDTYDNDWAAAAEYLSTQTGPLSGIGSAQVVGMLASNATTPDHPDVEVYIYGYALIDCAPGQIGALQSTGRRTVILLPSYLHPKSRGRVTLASNDPFELPNIWANYLAEPEDVAGMVQAIKLSVALLDTEALRGYDFTLAEGSFGACSDLEFQSDEYWACAARQENYPMYHQGGTCKMGPPSDPMAVVDSRLRVYGIEGLRVADTSIMPQVPSSNTAAPAMMIGERAADFIKKDWGRKFGQTRCSFSKSGRKNVDCDPRRSHAKGSAARREKQSVIKDGRKKNN